MNSTEMPKRFLDTTALETLRQTADWPTLCQVLNLDKDEGRSKPSDWWFRSPFSTDKTASFHIKPNDGIWYCFSTRQGGGVIELIQKMEDVNCFEAGDWLIDHGCAPEPEDAKLNQRTVRSREVIDTPVNEPITQSLLPNLSEQGRHAEFVRRGIGEKTCHYLGCGYLAKGRSALKDRLVFQIRGIEESGDELKSVILSHTGRATSDEQAKANGKWLIYAGFRKSLELYNLDKVLLDPQAQEQVRRTGQLLIVEGAFDVAKLVEAQVLNVVALLGTDLSDDAKPRFDLLGAHFRNLTFRVFLDRDEAGENGQIQTIEKLNNWGFTATGFDWEVRFGAQEIGISIDIQDPCDLSVRQIQWLRAQDLI